MGQYRRIAAALCELRRRHGFDRKSAHLVGANVEITITLANGQKYGVATSLDGTESDWRQLNLLGTLAYQGALYG